MAAQSFLLTRPAAASARFELALRRMFGAGITVVISPGMAPVFLRPDLPAGPFDALVLTSETGVEAARRISAQGQPLPVRAFCVGDHTAQMATAAGFVAQSAAGDADALLAQIRAEPAVGRLLCLQGRDHRGDIAERLTSDGIETRRAIVYAQRPCPRSAQAIALLAGADPVILPLFSPRSADLLVGTGPVAAPLWIAAISSAVADRAAALHPQRLVVADRPDAGGMLHAVQRLRGESLQVAGRQT